MGKQDKSREKENWLEENVVENTEADQKSWQAVKWYTHLLTVQQFNSHMCVSSTRVLPHVPL